LTLLEQAFGIERAFLSSIHAYSNQQNLADVPAEDPRRGRAAAENIIPQETKVAAVLEDILPSLAGRISASALNVPVHNGSVVDLVCWHRRPVTKTSINEVVRTAAASARWRRYLHYEDQPIVSSDVSRSPFSGIFDSDATMVLKGQVSKTLIWFDNSWGYVNRAAELIERLSQLDREQGRGLGSIASTARAGVPR
jgi:glyceraldehyde 3-phosphate dehydrogenase